MDRNRIPQQLFELKSWEFNMLGCLPTLEMGFDGALLKTVLETFVDDIAEESSELILERPRYAYAVVVIADEHELCEASCVRQLDVEILQTHNSLRQQEYYDSEIQRALRELKESRDLLATPRNSVAMDITNISLDADPYNDPYSLDIGAANPFAKEMKESSKYMKRSTVQAARMRASVRRQYEAKRDRL
ncbi:hypothetical protein ANCDUO_04569 [Ancylostoma duodenale]|uniref:Uncharacterized protein n=1 Tax=Ancylostoma duodenale TaxID=51022 RepID=A0A0C2GUM1_9BILA|nr:hypothetical protein ANCDUO_04569 [Ancylostoma duodenale]